MRRPDHRWLLDQIHDRFGALIEEHDLIFAEETDRAMVSSIRSDVFEVRIGVDGSVRDYWSPRRGRQVVLWSIDGLQPVMKHPYPACVGPGWRNAMVETIQQALTDGLKLEESPDDATA